MVGLSLVLIPLSMTGSLNLSRWREASFIAMVVVGAVLLVSFVVWERQVREEALHPSAHGQSHRLAACLIQVFDFMEYSPVHHLLLELLAGCRPLLARARDAHGVSAHDGTCGSSG